MQVQSVNTISNVYSNKFSSVAKSKKSNTNPSFRSIYINGEAVLNASEELLRNYAKMLRTLPDSEIRNATKEYGLFHVKRKISNAAYEKLSAEIREVQREVDALEQSSDPKDKEKLQKLYADAEEGRREYYKKDVSSDVTMYQDTIEGMSEDIRSTFI